MGLSLSSASPDVRKEVQTRFSYYVVGSKGTFGKKIGDRIEIVKLLYDTKNDRAAVECRIVVEEDMVDEKNVLHSGCATYLLDMTTALPFVLLGSVYGNETVVSQKSKFAMASYAPSQSLNIIHSGTAPLQVIIYTSMHHVIDELTSGSKLKIIAKTVTNVQNTLHVRGEIWDIERDVQVSYANQVKIMPREPPFAAIKLGLKL